ncbi:MAG TPA: hypothetical protein VI321_01565 [Burkholderiales bacterium]
MGGYISIAFLILGGVAALNPGTAPWAYIAALAAFEIWLLGQIRSAGRGPVEPEVPPYHFSAEEAALVARHRFYFMYPSRARQAASVLAAIGLSSLLLALWLTYKHAFVQAGLIGINLFAVSRLTRTCAPMMAVRMSASKGDRAALRMLEVHEPTWAKIRAANEAQA